MIMGFWHFPLEPQSLCLWVIQNKSTFGAHQNGWDAKTTTSATHASSCKFISLLYPFGVFFFWYWCFLCYILFGVLSYHQNGWCFLLYPVERIIGYWCFLFLIFSLVAVVYPICSMPLSLFFASWVLAFHRKLNDGEAVDLVFFFWSVLVIFTVPCFPFCLL